MKTDPVCGACGWQLSQHHHEKTGVYCNEITTGDVFTSDPSDEIVLSLFEKTWPQAREVLVRQWKIDNGHEVQS